MSARTRLNGDQITEALQQLPGWRIESGKLHRQFEFDDFVAAFGFMSACALTAEKMDHHPEWTNVYRTVTVDLTTHDAGGLTALDVELARAMSRLAGTR